MLQLIVLGQIPGTQYQLDFYAFLALAGVLAVIGLATLQLAIRRRRVIKQLAISLIAL